MGGQKRAREEPSQCLDFLGFLNEQRGHWEAQCNQHAHLQAQIATLRTALQEADTSRKTQLAIRREILRLTKMLPTEKSMETFEEFVKRFMELRGRLSDNDLMNLYQREVLASKIELNTVDLDSCPNCHKHYVQGSDQSVAFCTQCGTSVKHIDGSAVVSNSHGEEVDCQAFSYRRVNHLNERLNHFQAKETTEIKSEIFESIMKHLRSRGFRKSEDVKLADVKAALKALGLRKFYDSTMAIWCHVTNREPIRLTPLFLEKAHLLFYHLQKPFKKHCPPGRKNFMNYPSVMFFMCLLLGEHKILPFWTLLKGPDKLKAQLDIFNKICVELHWPKVSIPAEYIPPPTPNQKQNGTSSSG